MHTHTSVLVFGGVKFPMFTRLSQCMLLELRILWGEHCVCVSALTQYDGGNVAGSKVYTCEGHSDQKEVEVAVVPLGNTVPYPGTVVVKLLCEGEEGQEERGREGEIESRRWG